MENLRTPEDLCFLCQKNKADKKGSHFTPIGMVKTVVGKRNFEHEITISPEKGKLDQFFGRSNLNNTEIEIHQSENVADFIFCTECENNLGKIESECIDKLYGFTKKIKDEKIQFKTTLKGNPYFEFQHPNKNLLILFFYTIIWRQILLDSLTHKIQFPLGFTETLRNIINTEINKSRENIENSDQYIHYPNLIIYTSYHKDSDTTSYTYNPNPYPSNPELFTVGTYDVLIFKPGKISPHFSIETKLPTSILDNDLIINTALQSIVGIIDFDVWDTKQKFFYAKFADDFIEYFVTQITKEVKIDSEEARQLLMIETHLIEETEGSKNYGDFMGEASKNVIKKLEIKSS